jgi:hypothetical protein
MHDTRRINVHQMPEDRGLRWKRSRVFQYLFKRKLIVPSECNALVMSLALPAGPDMSLSLNNFRLFARIIKFAQDRTCQGA